MFNRKYIFKGSHFPVQYDYTSILFLILATKKTSAQQAQNTPGAANTLSKRFRDQCREKRILMRTLLQASHRLRHYCAPVTRHTGVSDWIP